MDDMTAFERQVARRFQHHAGAIRPVDDAAIFTAISATQSPGWRFQSMFSATRFVVAGAIVALFGGFLLAGVLTTQQDSEVPPAAGTESPSPMATEGLLSGMVTEEVEPGVYRVLSDGAGHDLAAEPPADVTVAPDGTIGLLRASGDRSTGPWDNGYEGLTAVIEFDQGGRAWDLRGVIIDGEMPPPPEAAR